MYCSHCGKDIPDNVRFCHHCGQRIQQEKAAPESYEKTRSQDTPHFTIKPVFIPWVTILSFIPLQIFFALWGGFMFGLPGYHFLGDFVNISAAGFVVFFALVFIIGIPVVGYFVKKKTYQKTEYRFFSDRLEYYEGFWTVEGKSISYRNIIEIHLRKGVIQKKYGLGCITLSTPSSGQSARSGGSIRITDIPDPDNYYQKVSALIK